MAAIFDLPWPPAVNNLYLNVKRGRVRTARYDAWLKDAAARLAEQRPVKVAGPFRIALMYERPDRRKRDLDGLAKAPLDLMVKAGVIDDDSLAQQITLLWRSPLAAKPGRVCVMVEGVAS